MGLLIDGKWHDQWYDTKSTQGEFVRKAPQFRNWVTPDGAAGPIRQQAASRPNLAAIISTSPSPAPGRTER